MNQIGIDICRVEVDAALNGAENGLKRFRTSELVRVELVTFDLQPAFLKILVAEAANIDIDRFRELAREIIDVDTGAAVNVRRIFVG
jgi:hypothetical protein